MNMEGFGFWEFFAGLGIFLFGMYQLEHGLNGLAGPAMKRILRTFTRKSWKGILTGASFTALLQSSSLVTLLVAAFLGAGLLNFRSALGVVLGANLGTTATAWIVALLGFKVDIARFSYPFLAIGTLSYILLDSRPVLRNFGRFLIGFGLIFLGLEHMKTSVDQLAQNVEFSDFNAYGLWMFVIFGLVITSLIQSSSAMIVIVLSALYSGILDIYQASAIVIGSNIGTTSTLFIASLNGGLEKKRLAAGNVIFNVVTAIVIFILLKPLIYVIHYPLGMSDSVIQLAAFNTFFNLCGIVLFYPFISTLIRFLKKIYPSHEQKIMCPRLNSEITSVPELAIKAVHDELVILFDKTKNYILHTLRYQDPYSVRQPSLLSYMLRKEENPFSDYEQLKKTEDEISAFYNRLSGTLLTEKEASQLNAYMDQLRSMVYAAKTIKDIHYNIKDLEALTDEPTEKLLHNLQKFTWLKLSEYSIWLEKEEARMMRVQWKDDIDKFYRESIEYIYKDIATRVKRGLPISTLTNIVKKSTTTLEEFSQALPLVHLSANTGQAQVNDTPKGEHPVPNESHTPGQNPAPEK
jgi:phosphate:Na+ symporter